MSLTLWRWGAVVTIGCAALAAALVPFRAPVAEHWGNATPEPLQRATSRLSSDVSRTHATLRAYRSALALERWRRSTRGGADTTSVRIDRSVPASMSAQVRLVVSEQWRALGNVSATNAEVFVYVDSTPVDRAQTAATSRWLLDRRGLVDVVFALPQATDGTRCVALVRLLGTSPSHIEALRHQSLVGVCGFFAAFGLPGAANKAWLAATDYRAARRSDWHVALAPMSDASAVYDIGAGGGRCLTHEPVACVDLLGASRQRGPSDPTTASELDFVLDGFSSVGAVDRVQGKAQLGTVEGELLMSAVREFGPERFGHFWRSAAPPDAAFANAMGVTLDAWTARWMQRTFGDLPQRPTPRLGHVIWLVAGAPVLLFIAARPRERVSS